MSRKVFTPGEILASADMNTLVMTPSGVVSSFAGSTAPTGYLLCDGQSVSTTTFASLFAVIGYQFGGSGGSFNVPNLKGRVPVGLDSAQTEFDARGETGGAKTHTLTLGQMPSHTHSRGTILTAASPANPGTFLASASASVFYSNSGSGFTDDGGGTGAAGSGQAHNNLQPYIVLNYIIKT
jgi:microcystin-dependent protein